MKSPLSVGSAYVRVKSKFSTYTMRSIVFSNNAAKAPLLSVGSAYVRVKSKFSTCTMQSIVFSNNAGRAYAKRRAVSKERKWLLSVVEILRRLRKFTQNK
ncbi:MAG: hypothetical protein LBN27_03350 [Prevotellaceae bacterium]|nr:hypothetical protein [Prevotellaceae bacterium]